MNFFSKTDKCSFLPEPSDERGLEGYVVDIYIMLMMLPANLVLIGRGEKSREGS